jgi:hypothetical protein
MVDVRIAQTSVTKVSLCTCVYAKLKSSGLTSKSDFIVWIGEKSSCNSHPLLQQLPFRALCSSALTQDVSVDEESRSLSEERQLSSGWKPGERANAIFISFSQEEG